MEKPGTVQLARTPKVIMVTVAVMVLAAVYIFQRFNYLIFFHNLFGIQGDVHPYAIFVVNRTIRLILNDSACLLLIWVWFKERKYIRLAGYIFIFELLILLPLYFLIKLSLEGDSEISSPLLSQVHRMIVNPMLMLLLMVAFLYQKKKELQ
jgi:exosortase F-associated protein